MSNIFESVLLPVPSLSQQPPAPQQQQQQLQQDQQQQPQQQQFLQQLLLHTDVPQEHFLLCERELNQCLLYVTGDKRRPAVPELGMTLGTNTPRAIAEWLRMYNMLAFCKSITPVRGGNCRGRVFRCTCETCPWKVTIARMKDGRWYITKIHAAHDTSCTSASKPSSNTLMNVLRPEVAGTERADRVINRLQELGCVNLENIGLRQRVYHAMNRIRNGGKEAKKRIRTRMIRCPPYGERDGAVQHHQEHRSTEFEQTGTSSERSVDVNAEGEGFQVEVLDQAIGGEEGEEEEEAEEEQHEEQQTQALAIADDDNHPHTDFVFHEAQNLNIGDLVFQEMAEIQRLYPQFDTH